MIKKIFTRLFITLLVISQISSFNLINARGGHYGGRSYGHHGDWGRRGWGGEGAIIGTGLALDAGLAYGDYDDYGYDYDDIY